MQPMRLLRIPQPFDHPDFIYEVKLDGFRGIAVVEGGRCRLFSRNGFEFKKWQPLADGIAEYLGTRSAVVDGEIACFTDDGRTDFYSLMFRRQRPTFAAFDLLELDGADLRSRVLIERKQLLRRILPKRSHLVRYVDHIAGRGSDFFRAVCERDLEGVVAKWARGRYQGGWETSWLKIKNPTYSQMEGRHELFESRRSRLEGAPRQNAKPVRLRLL